MVHKNTPRFRASVRGLVPLLADCLTTHADIESKFHHICMEPELTLLSYKADIRQYVQCNMYRMVIF